MRDASAAVNTARNAIKITSAEVNIFSDVSIDETNPSAALNDPHDDA